MRIGPGPGGGRISLPGGGLSGAVLRPVLLRAALVLAGMGALVHGTGPRSVSAQTVGDASGDPSPRSPLGAVGVLDVPFLPQSEALCGGAAAAMVMRYWNAGAVTAASFAGLVDAEVGGIPADELVRDLRKRGWRARAFRGSGELVDRLLGGGRPLVALLEVGPGRHHYVVVVARTEDGVLFHDPARAPFRRLGHREFRRRWEAAGRWTLLLLPPGEGGAGPAPRTPGRLAPSGDSARRARASGHRARGDHASGDSALRDRPSGGDAAPRPADARPSGGEAPPRPADARPSGGDAPPRPADPPPAGAAAGERPSEDAAGGSEACAEDVRSGVARARAGDEAAADSLLRRAAARCPTSPGPRRELAGLRFRHERWAAAAAQARAALEAAPADSQAARLLGASRYMLGDAPAALRAWNRIGRPEVSSVRVYGLRNTRWEAVEDRLPVSEGELLTPGDLALARRRAGAVPSLARARVRYRPLRDGTVDVQVAVVERPRLFGSPAEALAAALGALTERRVRVTAASLADAGELWSGSWRWWDGRPAVELTASLPGAFDLGGLWTVGGRWERETFAVPAAPAPAAPTSPGGAVAAAGDEPAGVRAGESTVGTERSRAALAVGRWATGGLRWEAGVALDRWVDRGSHLAPRLAVDLRPAAGRLAVRGAAAAWVGLAGGEAFPRGALDAAWRPVAGRRFEWDVRAGAAGAASEAPLSLWPGAGVGHGRWRLLRAHPLLEEGVIRGAGFGRILAHGRTEARVWLLRLGPLRAGVAGFVDAARAWGGPLHRPDAGLLVDAGGGLRLAPGGGGHLRVDAAGGLADDAGALSVGWRAPWPGW